MRTKRRIRYQRAQQFLRTGLGYVNMLTGEQPCEPDAATFQQRQTREGNGEGQMRGEGNGEGECDGEGNGEGECDGEGPHMQGEGQGECSGECDGAQTQTRTRCRLRYFHGEDFPQPGCDAGGCCQLNREDAEQVQNQERIQCRCRARGEQDPSSLPDCCFRCADGEEAEGGEETAQ